jgi:spoIIIJ-associated protein
VKDRVFTGPDVEEAIAVAAASLGLPRAELRYVVLDTGTAAGRGLRPIPARIAVLLEEAGRAPGRERASAPAGPSDPGRDPRPEPQADPRAGLRETIRAVAEAGGLDVEAEIQETDEAVVVHLRGADQAFFLGPAGRGDVLRATEHLLLRLHGAALQPRALRLTCEGFRERRDEALAAEARDLAAAMRADGQPRVMEPLNAYERRIVHVALQDEPGVTTYSVGEGASRRVTVAPARPPDPAPGAHDGAE